MSQPNANPFAWGRDPSERPDFGGFSQHERNVCRQLQDIFVSRMGIAQSIGLEICQNSGERILHVHVAKDSPMLNQWLYPNVYGIAVKVSVIP